MKLVIAEKPSVAQNISAVIGAKVRKDGYMEGNGYLVSWCVGHLVELASADCYDEKYAKWQYKDLPILPLNNWKYVISKGKEKQMKIIGNLMKRSDVTEIIAATANASNKFVIQSFFNTNTVTPISIPANISNTLPIIILTI